MKRYPVAGELLEHRLFFGLTLQDLVVGAFPIGGLGLGFGVNSTLHPPGGALLPLIFGFFGIIVALYVLIRTPAGQTPYEWVRGAAFFYAGPTRFLWQPVERNQSQGRILDDIRTLHDNPDQSTQQLQVTGSNTSPQPSGEDDTYDSDNDEPTILPDGGTQHTRKRASRDPSQYYHQLTQEETTTQSQIAFEYVREDGIVVTDTDSNGNPTSYVGLVNITPTSWIALDDEGRQDTIQSFAGVLRGISYPFQLLALPREFDLTEHLDAVHNAGFETEGSARALDIARSSYLDWLSQTIGTQRIKVRDYYAAVRVEADHVRDASYGHASDAVAGSILERVVTSITTAGSSIRNQMNDTDPGVIERQCLQEVRSRQQELADALPRTGVQTEVMEDRDDVLDVFYRYYNHAESPLDTYTAEAYADVLPEVAKTTSEKSEE